MRNYDDDADFDQDVRDETTVRVEELGLRWLRSVAKHDVVDVRHRHLPWDATVTRELRADFKADRYVDASGNVVFEEKHTYPDGREKPGWGRNRDLDLVVVVGTTSLRAAVLNVRRFRRLVEWKTADGTLPRGWRRFQRKNNGYVTHGVCVPLDQLRMWGAVHAEPNLARFMADTEPGGEDAVVAMVESRRKR